MTRIAGITDGAEMGDTLYYDAITGIGSVSASTAQKRSGSYSYLLDGLGGVLLASKSLPAATQSLYYRVGLYLPSGLLSDILILDMRYASDLQLEFCWDAGSGVINCYRYDLGTPVLVLSSTLPIAAETWTLLEIYANINTSGGSLAYRVGGATAGSYTGNTRSTNASANLVDGVRHIISGNYDVYYDDMAADDTTWCGEGHIEGLDLIADGDVIQWTNSAGGTVNNYSYVDEVPPSALDYVEDNTVGHQDLYRVENFDFSGKTINLVMVDARALDEAATGNDIKLLCKTGGTIYASATKDLTDTAARYVYEMATNPGGGAWTEAQLDLVQIGQETA